MNQKTKPVLAVTRRFSENVENRLQANFSVIGNPDDKPLTRQDILSLCQNADGLLCCGTERIDRELIENLPPGLKIISTFSVGYDHIDIDAARERGLCVTNTPDVLTRATAEIAVLLILATCRRARESQAVIDEGRWGRWSPGFLLGRQLSDAEIGFVGMGRIARMTASMLRPFGAKMRYWNRTRYAAPLVDDDIEFVPDLDRLFTLSNLVTLHVPGGEATQGLVNGERLASMPRGSMLINTARGSIVDDDALIDALNSGHLAGAGLDVFQNEPNLDPRYLELPNVFMLPHIGSATTAARDGMGHRAMDNLEAFLSGGEPKDRVV